MSENKLKLELDINFVKEIFNTAGLPIPEQITQKEFESAITVLKANQKSAAVTKEVGATTEAKSKPKEEKTNAKKATKETPGESETSSEAIKRIKSVLIVDDLGIIVYQLSLLFKRLDFDVVTSQEINDAIDKYKKKDFGYVILDLFIPTEREGFYLLDEMKKLSLFCKLNTKIIVMSAISKEAYKAKIVNHGADCFIEKTQGWQRKLMDACAD